MNPVRSRSRFKARPSGEAGLPSIAPRIRAFRPPPLPGSPQPAEKPGGAGALGERGLALARCAGLEKSSQRRRPLHDAPYPAAGLFDLFRLESSLCELQAEGLAIEIALHEKLPFARLNFF